MKRLYERKNPRLRRLMIQAVRFAIALLFIVAATLFRTFAPPTKIVSPYTMSARGAGEMRLHFLDVGQADCTVVELPTGQTVVVDGGDGSFESNLHLLRYIKGLGSPALTLVATHADYDHCGGLSYLVKSFGAEVVYLPALSSQTSAFRSLISAIERTKTPSEVLSRYCAIGDSSAYALCLSPYSVDETDGNDASAIFFLSYAGVHVLLGADITSARENVLLTEYLEIQKVFEVEGYTANLRETDILKVSHHGSAGSSSQAWLELLRPETAILSCGEGNRYGHPAPEAISRLSKIGAELYRTDELGDITITISPDGTYRVEWHRYR